MAKIGRRLYAFFRQEKAATSIEYGLIAGGISLAILAVVLLFGDNLMATYNFMMTRMEWVNSQFGG
ncbi:MAG: Flp family type IVb pilin [Alphaproteobacteria bacterium]|nr:Flp family type IVb pilin [Alphaproteobacteria bacterium]MCD8520008.1 Flp family type IVb pilin [Alphaproteobacteria bacterium]MCD8571740.1 Flp family type IVb pilin [Alphaproteobacteria bacterium]